MKLRSLVAAIWLLAPGTALAQSNCVMPITGPQTMAAVMATLNTCLAAQAITKIATTGISLNALGDTTIAVPARIGNLHYLLWQIALRNSGSVASLTSAQYGLFTGAGGTGVAIIAAGTALSAITSNTDNTSGNMLLVAGNNALSLTQSTVPSIFFRVTQVQSAGAALDAFLYLRWMN